MKKIDVTHDHCPMTYAKVKIALDEMSGGDLLEVILLPGEPLENIPKSTEDDGNRVTEIWKESDKYHLIIEKKGRDWKKDSFI